MLLFLYVTEEAGRKYVRDMPWPPAAECNMITNKQTIHHCRLNQLELPVSQHKLSTSVPIEVKINHTRLRPSKSIKAAGTRFPSARYPINMSYRTPLLSCFTTTVILYIFFSRGHADLQTNSLVSIQDTTDWALQVLCVRHCVFYPGNSGDLAYGIKCTSPWMNSCFCNDKSAPSASEFLTTCVRSNCTSIAGDAYTTKAVASAVSLYNLYCQGDSTMRTAALSGSEVPSQSQCKSNLSDEQRVYSLTLVSRRACFRTLYPPFLRYRITCTGTHD